MATVAGLIDSGLRHRIVDYIDLMRMVKAICRRSAAVEEMFRRMVFSVRALNRDDHVRNHAFIMDAPGSWSLAHAYDVSFSEGLGGEAGEGRKPDLVAFPEVARIAGIRPARRDDIIAEVDGAISSMA
ncbi:HipA domain-containing protein [Paracoccus sp. PAR01]|uniref:HipA domain-containing protein n=1 Tax=Paracoccus sp. PAR01 TaxID=2769282 RepID=UPI00351C5C40